MSELLPMDERDGVIWLDGALLPWRDARMHVLSHGLHYASTVFEGERVYDGRVFELAAHGRRLLRSCAIMDMECPWSAAALDRAAIDVVEANGIADGYLRRIAWRGALERRLDSKRIASMVWVFTVLMMVFFLMAGMSVEDRLLGLMMIGNELAFLIGAGVYWLTYRIEQAELNTREKLLQLELRLAELGERG